MIAATPTIPIASTAPVGPTSTSPIRQPAMARTPIEVATTGRRSTGRSPCGPRAIRRSTRSQPAQRVAADGASRRTRRPRSRCTRARTSGELRQPEDRDHRTGQRTDEDGAGERGIRVRDHGQPERRGDPRPQEGEGERPDHDHDQPGSQPRPVPEQPWSCPGRRPRARPDEDGERAQPVRRRG